MITATTNVFPRRLLKIKCQRGFVEIGPLAEDEPCERPESFAEAVKLGLGILKLEPQALVDFLIKVFKELFARVIQPGADGFIHFSLERLECGIYLFRRSAFLVYGQDAFFEIDSRFDRAEHFVRGTKYTAKQAELLGQQFQHSAVRFVPLVEEIDDDHVVLLPVTMAAAYTLFYSLRVPGQVKIGRA